MIKTIVNGQVKCWYSRKEAIQHFREKYLFAKINKQDTKTYLEILNQLKYKNLCISNSGQE